MSMEGSAMFSFDNPVFSYYAFYSTLLLVKTLLLVFVIAHYRTSKKVYISAEDRYFMKDAKINTADPDVERAKRVHMNALENIPIFILLGAFYVLTNPSATVALWHFRIYALARIEHSLFYLFGWQPHRAIMFFAGLAVTCSLAVQVLLFAPYW